MTRVPDSDRAHAPFVARMNAAIVHRGPDDSGQWDSDQISVAMRRLAIIDLAGGHQPIENEDGSLLIFMNGEIYNYLDLRPELERLGHRFRTQSDTEVVLHLYEELGPEVASRLEGMFALCIVDRRRQELFLARDRFGEKPLFYWHDRDALAFSSELRSLLECPRVPRQLNPAGLECYLRHRILPGPQTFFRDVVQLPPGHWMTWRNGKVEVARYFELQAEPERGLDLVTAKMQIQDALLRAVRRQQISEVPLGAFLSGGIDSSTVVAAMQRTSSKPVLTFTARFENQAYDESPIARRVSQHLGTEHHEFVIPNQGFEEEDLWRVIRHMGQPFADSSAIPTYYICRQIRDRVTVCLSGDGGDEMFGGYSFFRDCQRVEALARWAPRSAFRSLQKVARSAAGWPGLSGSRRLRQVMQASASAGRPAGNRFLYTAPLYDDGELARLFKPEVRRNVLDTESAGLGRFAGDDFPSRLRQWMAYRAGFQLPEDMLVKVDRMSMANSLEVRAPMLDVAVAEVARRLPDDLLIRDGVTKFALRAAAREWLPAEVFDHPKWGFAIPLHDYQNDRYRALCGELILAPDSLVQSLFRPDFVRRIVDRGLTRRQDAADVSVFRASHQVWALLQLGAWSRYFGVSG